MSAVASDRPKKVTVRTLQARHDRGEAIAMVTAYDYPSAKVAEEAGVDVVLVGDSLGMVVLGYESTLPVTMDEMVHHARAVARGARTPLLVGDMPFLSYQADPAEAVRNAGRFLKEAGMDAVKLEGGQGVVPVVEALVRSGIPVMGHVGLTPQHIRALGGWRVQGKTADAARALLEGARALEEAGCFAVVLESVPSRLAAHITAELGIPTIGIGAGVGTGGQVLVWHDLLGLQDEILPRFVKRYAELRREAVAALAAFRDEVRARAFPGPEHGYDMDDAEWEAFLAATQPAPAVAGPRPLRAATR